MKIKDLTIQSCPKHFITELKIDVQGNISAIGNDESFATCPKCKKSVQFIIEELVNELKQYD